MPVGVQVAVLLDRAGMGHLVPKLGISGGFGFLQHRVLCAALKFRTISVRGTVRLPAALDVDVADEDWPVVAVAPEAFLRDIALVLQSEADERGWEIRGHLDLRFATLSEATPGRPVVALACDRDTTASSVASRTDADGLSATLPRPGELLPTLGATGLAPTVRAPGLVLVPHDASDPMLQLSLSDTEIVVGRDGGVDLVVAHPTVSARHCRLVRGPCGSWEISDLHSKNGTWVNNSQAHRALPLTVGDIVVLGTVRYEVASL